jgi:hypothetical protein
MKKLIPAFVCLAISLPAVAVRAQTDACAAIRAAKENTYNFHPARVDKKTREAKSKEMDAFWNQVKAAGPGGVACLRNLLADQKQSDFFLFDGSSLLLSLDQSDGSLKTIRAAVERADMNDVDTAGYLSLLIELAKKDVDIGPLAARYLKRSDAGASVPQHAMTVDRASAAVLLYGAMPAADVDRYLVPELQDANPDVRAAAAIALAINMTEDSFRALKAFPHLAALPPEIKKEVDLYMKRTPVPAEPAKFSREQVLAALRRIPHSREEYERASSQRSQLREKYDAEHPIDRNDAEASMKRERAFEEEVGPYLYVAGNTEFIKSAIAMLTEQDLPLVREERRKQVRLSDEAFYEWGAYTRIIEGVINRLDLYKEHRVH